MVPAELGEYFTCVAKAARARRSSCRGPEPWSAARARRWATCCRARRARRRRPYTARAWGPCARRAGVTPAARPCAAGAGGAGRRPAHSATGRTERRAAAALAGRVCVGFVCAACGSELRAELALLRVRSVEGFWVPAVGGRWRHRVLCLGCGQSWGCRTGFLGNSILNCLVEEGEALMAGCSNEADVVALQCILAVSARHRLPLTSPLSAGSLCRGGSASLLSWVVVPCQIV